LVLSVLVTLIPSLISMAVLWWLDRYEKEPLWLLGIAFFWGAVPTIGLSLVAQLLIEAPLATVLGHSVFYPLASLSLVAPLTEETFKALILLALFVLYRQEFDGVMDGILYGALIGFGFSVVEDVFYMMSSLMYGGGWAEWGVVVALRVGLYNLNHSLFAACTGIGFGLARNRRAGWQRWIYPLLGWLAAVLLHGLHNAGTVLAESTEGMSILLFTVVDWMGVLGMLALIIYSVRRERQWFQELEPEIASGVVTPVEAEWASTYRTRVAYGWQVLRQHGLRATLKWSRFVQMIVDLAYKKHQKQAAQEAASTDERIARLRGRIASLRPELPQIGELRQPVRETEQ
jgi:RsiW-degrading membrane proteinase PrsW (M82 family)